MRVRSQAHQLILRFAVKKLAQVTISIKSTDCLSSPATYAFIANAMYSPVVWQPQLASDSLAAAGKLVAISLRMVTMAKRCSEEVECGRSAENLDIWFPGAASIGGLQCDVYFNPISSSSNMTLSFSAQQILPAFKVRLPFCGSPEVHTFTCSTTWSFTLEVRSAC